MLGFGKRRWFRAWVFRDSVVCENSNVGFTELEDDFQDLPLRAGARDRKRAPGINPFSNLIFDVGWELTLDMAKDHLK